MLLVILVRGPPVLAPAPDALPYGWTSTSCPNCQVPFVLLRCPGCRSCYCSAACQEAAWAKHRLVCDWRLSKPLYYAPDWDPVPDWPPVPGSSSDADSSSLQEAGATGAAWSAETGRTAGEEKAKKN